MLSSAPKYASHYTTTAACDIFPHSSVGRKCERGVVGLFNDSVSGREGCRECFIVTRCVLVVLPGDDGTVKDDDWDDFRGGDKVLDGDDVAGGDKVLDGDFGGGDDEDVGPADFLLLGVEGRAGA